MTATPEGAPDAQAAGAGRLLDWLEPQDLTNKWGFGDGDMADDWLDGWAAASWPAGMPERARKQEMLDSYLNSRELLGAAVKELLVPSLRLPPHFTDRESGTAIEYGVGYVGTVHNPWRLVPMAARSADGSPVLVDDIDEDAWERIECQAGNHLERCHPVAVPIQWAWQRCEELYPRRGGGWLDLMTVLAERLPSGNLLAAAGSPGNWYWSACTLADALAEGYGDDVVGLAAELATGLAEDRAAGPLTVDQVRQALASAQLVAGTPDRRVRVPGPRGSAAALIEPQ